MIHEGKRICWNRSFREVIRGSSIDYAVLYVTILAEVPMKTVLMAFGEYLARKGVRFEATIIGGAALIALGLIDRPTRDVDCLDPEIPDPVKAASQAFAKEYRGVNAPLKEDWLNNGPRSLVDDLPAGWRSRLQSLFTQGGIVIRTLGRSDLLLTKLFAYCDRQQD